MSRLGISPKRFAWLKNQSLSEDSVRFSLTLTRGRTLSVILQVTGIIL